MTLRNTSAQSDEPLRDIDWLAGYLHKPKKPCTTCDSVARVRRHTKSGRRSAGKSQRLTPGWSNSDDPRQWRPATA
jgi:hypothetical protein